MDEQVYRDQIEPELGYDENKHGLVLLFRKGGFEEYWHGKWRFHTYLFTILFIAYLCVISLRVCLKVSNYILSKIYNKRRVTKAHLRFSLSAQKYMERLKSSVNSRYRKAIERGQSTIGSPNSFGKPVIRTRSSSPAFSRLN